VVDIGRGGVRVGVRGADELLLLLLFLLDAEGGVGGGIVMLRCREGEEALMNF
jgi:hypothetical protein